MKARSRTYHRRWLRKEMQDRMATAKGALENSEMLADMGQLGLSVWKICKAARLFSEVIAMKKTLRGMRSRIKK